MARIENALFYNRAFLRSDALYLRLLTTQDITEVYLEWLNDAETNEYTSRYRFPLDLSNIGEYIKDSINEKRMVFAICLFGNKDIHIGNIVLQEIDWINRSAELAIIIGDKRYKGKGYGSDACRLLVAHAFNRLNLHRIWLGTPEKNLPMIKTATKLGMELEGVFKDAFYCQEGYIKVNRYAIINKTKEVVNE